MAARKTTTRKAAEPKTRTLLVEKGNSMFKVTIPEDWKVTYGRLYGYPKAAGNAQIRNYENPGMALRIYETETKQRACFTGVTGFRDLSLPVEVLVVEENGEETWTVDSEGNAQRQSSKNITKSFKVESY